MNNMNSITTNDGSTCFNGPDATKVFAAQVLSSALRGYAKHRLLMSRGYTPTKMLVAATRYTGVRYKRGEYAKASNDLSMWVKAHLQMMQLQDDGKDIASGAAQ
jgi:hypothetical protein